MGPTAVLVTLMFSTTSTWARQIHYKWKPGRIAFLGSGTLRQKKVLIRQYNKAIPNGK